MPQPYAQPEPWVLDNFANPNYQPFKMVEFLEDISHNGACVGCGPSMWFEGDPDAPRGQGRNFVQHESTRRAMEICNDCPVKIECQMYAVLRGEQHGVWGGMTASQRYRAFHKTFPRWSYCMVCKAVFWRVNHRRLCQECR